MTEELCNVEGKNGGGIEKINIRCDANSGNTNGGGYANLSMNPPHPFSKARCTERTGSWGSNTRTYVGGTQVGNPSVGTEYDIKDKSLNMSLWNNGGAMYKAAAVAFDLIV